MNQKKTRLTYFLTFFLSPFFLFSQCEWNNWYFGEHAAITFNTNPPSALLDCAIGGTINYPVSISDSLGNLLFYSDGLYVFDANNNVMPNGSGLNQAFGLQTVFSIKKPGTNNIYYLFYVADYIPYLFLGLFYSIIDIDLNSGLGDIIPGQKNIPVPEMSDAMDLLNATRHKNNKDVWLITKKYLTNQYASILITDTGISSSIVYSNSNASVMSVQPGSGELKISPDGQKLICRYYPQNEYAAEFCSFNTETGVVSYLFNMKLIIGLEQGFMGSLGFSPNSKYIYILGHLPAPSTIGGIFQYDISLTDSSEILNSKIQVYEKPANPPFILSAPFQIGPDWKLYFPSWSYDSIHVINFPNIQGIGCNVQINAISLEGRFDQVGLPQFLQKYKAYIAYTGNCEPDTFHFSSDIWPPADTILWNFGDPASGAANFSTNSTPEHKFSSPGQYTIELYVRHIDNRTDTTWVTLNIYSLPMPDLGPDTIICQGDFITFDAGVCSGCTYLWTDITTGLTIGTGQTLTTGQTGTYAVIVTSGSNCQGRDTVQLIITLPPSITSDPLLKSICSGESTNIPLTSNVPNTDFSWTAIGSSPLVAGFSSGTGDIIDQVLANSGSGPETVTYTITPAVGNCAGDSVQYVVTVTPGDSVMVTISSSADSVCEGTPVTFSATPTNGGIIPTFQWMVNGISQGANDSIFTYVPLNGDNITCVLTSSKTVCYTNNPATSNPIIIQVSLAPEVFFIPCVDTMTTTNAKPIKLKGGIPLGGTYSGPGVSDGFFYPAVAGTGTHQITYTYANYSLCSDTGYLLLEVKSNQPFSCGDNLLDIRDNTIYPTVQIGTQCWFALNLDYGSEIPYTTPQRDNCIPEKYTIHQSPVTSHSFYQWDELMSYEDTEQIQGLCPPGWHVPSESDWNQLFAFYQGNAFAGSPLLYSGFSGFNALLTGAGFLNKPLEFEGFATLFWSSTSHGPRKAWAHGMNDYNNSVSFYPCYRANAFPVRCVKD